VALAAGAVASSSLFAAPALKPYVVGEILPGTDIASDDELLHYLRQTGSTVFHATCTCKMGHEDDESAVVDPHLRVRGVERLRVVDASVMPDLISGNINAPVMMIAEKAADMIRGTPTLAPLNA
jgi:choline dehydrogenase-like flavoprotein